MREICEVLGFTRSNFYFQPKSDPSENVLRAEIEKLAAAYPTYGYRRITHVLVKAGYGVGYRHVARLMKSENLSVAIKRARQTTHSTDGLRPWSNHLKTLEVCQCDQVWVGDITYVRLKGHFIYLALLMDVFTRRCAVSFKCLSLDAQMSWDRDFRSTSRVSLGERICRKTHPHPQGGRSSPQRLSGHPRSERSYQSFYHTGISPKTPAFGIRVSETSRISAKKLVLTLLIFGLNKRWHFSG